MSVRCENMDDRDLFRLIGGSLVAIVGLRILFPLNGEKQITSKQGMYNEHFVVADSSKNGKSLTVSPQGFCNVDTFIYAHGKDEKGRFTDIKVVNVPRGHGLEKYTGLDSLDKIYEKIR